MVWSCTIRDMIHEHERVILLVDLPEYELVVGDVGVVVHIYSTGNAYEVEFFTLDGQTLEVVTLDAKAVRPVRQREVTFRMVDNILVQTPCFGPPARDVEAARQHDPEQLPRAARSRRQGIGQQIRRHRTRR